MLSRSSKLNAIATLRHQMLRLDVDRTKVSCGLGNSWLTKMSLGTIIEYLAGAGNSATTLAMIAAREVCREGKSLVVVDWERNFYPPAGTGWGIGPETVIVRPRNQKDLIWTLNQSLSCTGVGAVLSWPQKLEPKIFRSLQLAAEKGGSVGLFVRPNSVRGEPSWADMQMLVQSMPTVNARRKARVQIVRCRSGNVGASIELEIDDETGAIQESSSLHLASELADAKILH